MQYNCTILYLNKVLIKREISGVGSTLIKYMKKLVVLTGAGVSQESGISTFRDAEGLWEGHDITEVASLEGFANDPETVLSFYNQRRKQLLEVEPNNAHHYIAALEDHFDVQVITQNVDDLHERAGSTKVHHLHGELRKVRSTKNDQLIVDWQDDLIVGDLAVDGSQLRPHIVWFGEEVFGLKEVKEICATSDIMLVVGTSLTVYPAAGLIYYPPKKCPIILIDPNKPDINMQRIHFVQKKAVVGMEEVAQQLVDFYT